MSGRRDSNIYTPGEVPAELRELVAALAEEYPLRERGRGTRVTFRKIEGEGTVSRVVAAGRDAVRIEYNSVTAAGRGIGAALAGLKGEEKTTFTTLGIMIDLSRNLVMKPAYLERWFRRLALAGYNTVWLYTEDVYELPGEPLFGYQRGAYSLEDLQGLDRSARRLGIELSGCIQTLGHLDQLLKWHSAYLKYADTRNVLQVGKPETYGLIGNNEFSFSTLFSRLQNIYLDLSSR